jgi:hypothetical protein
LQLVGITEDEYRAARRWSGGGMLEILARSNPLLLTEIARESVLVGETAIEVAEATRRDGSSLFAQFASFSEVIDGGERGVRIVCSAADVRNLVENLEARMAADRYFHLISPYGRIVFTPNHKAGFVLDEDKLFIDVSPALVRELLATLGPKRGIVRSFVLKGLSFAIEPTAIRDAEGNVVEIVG